MVGRAVGFRLCQLFGAVLESGEVVAVVAREKLPFLGFIVKIIHELRIKSVCFADLFGSVFQLFGFLREICASAREAYRLGKVGGVHSAESLFNALRHGIIKIRNRLPAVLVVLVGLYGYTRERGIAGDVIWLTQEAVPRGKSAMEQLKEVNLTAGGSQRQKIQVVDMYIAVYMSVGVGRVKDIYLVELLGTLRAVFQHRAHGGVTVNIGVFALDVSRRFESKILIYLHQLGVHLAGSGTLCPVENVRLGGLGVPALDKHFLHHVLNLLDRGVASYDGYGKLLADLVSQLHSLTVVVASDYLRRLVYRRCYFLNIKRNLSSVPLFYHGNHCHFALTP